MKQPFEIRRIDGKYPVEQISSSFNEYGVIVLIEYMPRNIRNSLRNILTAKLERSRARGNVLKYDKYPAADFLLGDVLSIRELEEYDYVFFSDELVQVLKIMLSSKDVIYYSDSNIQFDAAERGFHKDNTERYDANSDDWLGDYGLVRAGFYCEDHMYNSGGLKVRLKSHKLENTRSKFNPNKISAHAGRSIDIRSEFGDLLIWSMRLTHSGNYKKIKLLPAITVHPRLEKILPNFLVTPEQERRYAMFCSFGKPGKHLDYYIEKFDSRGPEVPRYLETARRAEEIVSYLASRGVTQIKPTEYVGIDDNDS
jgi:hypothetical protein